MRAINLNCYKKLKIIKTYGAAAGSASIDH